MASPQDIAALMAAAHRILQETETDSPDARQPLRPIHREARRHPPGSVMFDIGDLDALATPDGGLARSRPGAIDGLTGGR